MAAPDRSAKVSLIEEDRIFTLLDIGAYGLLALEYDRCTFDHLDLKNADLSKKTFVECVFRDCDLSLVQLECTSFRVVRFERCKLLGARFDSCHTFLIAFTFDQCILDLATFHGLRLKGTKFDRCRMRETDLSSADFTNGSFAGSDLGAAVFDGTVLEGADFRGALNYSIDPSTNRIRKARFSKDGVAGLLDRTGIIIED